MKVTVESDSEGEEDEEEEDVVVEVEQRPSSLSLQDRITGRQLEHMQVSQTSSQTGTSVDKIKVKLLDLISLL